LLIAVRVVSIDDAGQGADDPTLSASLTLADSGSTADDGSFSIGFTIADSGGGSDFVSGTNHVVISDHGRGEHEFLPARVGIARVGQSRVGRLRSIHVEARISTADSAFSLDDLLISWPIDVADEGHGAEDFSIAVSTTILDEAAGNVIIRWEEIVILPT